MEDVEKLSQSERMRLSNKEAWTQWAVDVTKSPYDLPLESLNPGHPMLFEADASLAYFERLRKEDPVHRCENSQFGHYWSVTRYQDIMAVDTNHRAFSSDSRKGGIQLGTGGLARAYGGSAARCLQLGERQELVTRLALTCHLQFAELPLFKARLGEFDALLASEEYDASGARLQLAVPAERQGALARLLADISRGREQLHKP